MKNITHQYKDLKEGKMSQANFMRNVRMTFPHLVTNITSFDDSVKILKNKGLLNEDITGQQMAGNPAAEKASREAFRSSAFRQGQEASKNDVDINENPFDEDSMEGQEWIDGWMSVANEIEAATNNFEDEDFPLEENMPLNEDDEIEKAIADLKREIDHLKSQNPEETAPEIILDKIDDINAEIVRLEDKEGIDEKKFIPDPEQLATGIKTEKEHTKNKEVARKIAMDHLKEKPNYYTKLKKAGLEEAKGAVELRGSGGVFYKEIDSLNAQEVLNGIDWEMENNHELSKEEATKIVIKKLNKNPFYYTYWDMAGVEGAEDEILGDIDPKIRQMKPYAKDKVVDKDMGMKPVKGVEKIKASANKANKETNKVVKGVQQMTHNTKSVRGITRMDATGGKMKKVSVKESLTSLIKQIIAEELKKNNN